MTIRTDDLLAGSLVSTLGNDELGRVVRQFAVAVTDDVAGLIDPADPADPIAAQFLPTVAELQPAADDQPDPIGDARWSPLPGIVHRYPDRVLLKPVLTCPVYCRFCFRREQVGKDGGVLSPAALDKAFAYIAKHPEIWEVIVTGGDPFVLSPRRIGSIVRRLEAIDHVAVTRFHTRVPVVEPLRVSAALVAALTAEKAVYVVIHANHPRELTPAVRDAVKRITQAGIPVLSQSVLLRGVNDDAAVLEGLFRALVAMRVKPYYLHHPDLAPGTGHFRLGIGKGRRLVGALRGRVSGLCQPGYVLDIPGGYGKVPIAASAARPITASSAKAAAGKAASGKVPSDERAETWIVDGPDGRQHLYPPATGENEG
ncbi:MAG TPA: lysine-2,3-aminomutase-like protein [Stellaceae bacterium]|jgi:lysine 2,3-aminomutase|nr:lysine-2,3-aminomutase-like protein [Stellaceae bacterium]